MLFNHYKNTNFFMEDLPLLKRGAKLKKTRKYMSNELTQMETDAQSLLTRSISNVRDEIADNPYIEEALRVIPVGGYRSAIGSFWNAVVDDLRNKIMHRSLSLFNKSFSEKKEVKSYEDFQNKINDDELIQGAYDIGVIGWEASKVLKHAKETRHIFSGHPKSSDPSIIKVLGMFEDCIKYVLNEPYPPQIIDISEYIIIMDSSDFDRNEIAVSNAIEELPEIYKSELINRIFKSYILEESSSELRSNIEFIAPLLWRVLPREHKNQIVKTLDKIIGKSNTKKTKRAFKFVQIVEGNIYLSPSARNYIIRPLVKGLKESLDEWNDENKYVKSLEQYASYIPLDLLKDYVSSLTHTYVGYIGQSAQFSRRDFFANAAAPKIQTMFSLFDDNAALEFVQTIKESKKLKNRIEAPTKLTRLRTLGNIILEKVSTSFSEKEFLELLVNEKKEKEFWKKVKS